MLEWVVQYHLRLICRYKYMSYKYHIVKPLKASMAGKSLTRRCAANNIIELCKEIYSILSRDRNCDWKKSSWRNPRARGNQWVMLTSEFLNMTCLSPLVTKKLPSSESASQDQMQAKGKSRFVSFIPENLHTLRLSPTREWLLQHRYYSFEFMVWRLAAIPEKYASII